MHFINIVIFSWKSGGKLDLVGLSRLGRRKARLPCFMPARSGADTPVA